MFHLELLSPNKDVLIFGELFDKHRTTRKKEIVWKKFKITSHRNTYTKRYRAGDLFSLYKCTLRKFNYQISLLFNLLTCAVESYPTPGDIDDSSSPTPPTP